MLTHIMLSSLSLLYNVKFVLFHNAACYTNSLLSYIHVNTIKPPYYRMHFVDICVILRRL